MSVFRPQKMLSVGCGVLVVASVAVGTDVPVGAPTFERPFNGSPIEFDNRFHRIIPEALIDTSGDCSRALDPGGCPPTSLPASFPASFTEDEWIPAAEGMTIGMPYFGQFVAHDQSWIRDAADFWLVEPFVFAAGADEAGLFHNRKTPALDLDNVYEFGPVNGLGQPEGEAWYDESNLRFRFATSAVSGRPDFLRNALGRALTADPRDDENGVVGQMNLAFRMLHNAAIDMVIERDDIDEAQLEIGSEAYWAIFNEARNYTIAYYQGLIAGEYAQMLSGRTLWDARADESHPVGSLVDPYLPLEFGGALFRHHTMVPNVAPNYAGALVSPVDPVLRHGAPWNMLFGPGAPPAAKYDLAHAPELRDIFNLIIPGSPFPITMDLAQVNVLRGREMELPSGEEYLAFLLDELGLDASAATIRGKTVLTARTALTVLDPDADADLLADLANGDTDLYAYMLAEGQLNGGLLGPVGQDVMERTWISLLEFDDYSLMGAFADQFTPEQMAFFQNATIEGLLDQILPAADLSRDGLVNATDLAMMLARWGATDDPADLDGDGVVGASDIMLLIEAWN